MKRFIALLLLIMLALCSCTKVTEHNPGGINKETLQIEEQNSTMAQIELESDTATGKQYSYDDCGFVSDISKYEEYMNPENRDEYLILINSNNLLDKDYVPSDLIDVVNTRQDGRETQQMRLYAAKALEAMFTEMNACGYTDVSVTSAYRSYSRQEYLFNSYCDAHASSYDRSKYSSVEEYVKTFSALPGTSEHQSGLCCDMHNLPSADKSFAKKEAAKWLAENSYKFGFILRYPEDKTDITAIDFEPWHFRYVGRFHAAEMYNKGLCLEEYCEIYKS